MIMSDTGILRRERMGSRNWVDVGDPLYRQLPPSETRRIFERGHRGVGFVVQLFL